MQIAERARHSMMRMMKNFTADQRAEIEAAFNNAITELTTELQLLEQKDQDWQEMTGLSEPRR